MKYTDLPTRIFWGSCITLIISKEPLLMLNLIIRLQLHRTGSFHMRFL